MADRLISVNVLKRNFQDELCKGIACDECSMQVEGFCRVERWIDITPTLEAEPKHGRWIRRGDNSWECSECHEISCCKGNYCVDCGAKMFDKDTDVPDKNVGKMDEVKE